jgi:hypothetical protein
MPVAGAAAAPFALRRHQAPAATGVGLLLPKVDSTTTTAGDDDDDGSEEEDPAGSEF